MGRPRQRTAVMVAHDASRAKESPKLNCSVSTCGRRVSSRDGWNANNAVTTKLHKAVDVLQCFILASIIMAQNISKVMMEKQNKPSDAKMGECSSRTNASIPRIPIPAISKSYLKDDFSTASSFSSHLYKRIANDVRRKQYGHTETSQVRMIALLAVVTR